MIMIIMMIMVMMMKENSKLQRISLNSMQLKLGFYSELNFQDRTSTTRNETVTHSMANSMIELGWSQYVSN